MSNDDWQLLRQFVQGSQPAFSELFGRYVRLVHGRCLRQLGDAHAADDVTQAVFLVLAKRAAWLTRDVPLGAWLYRVTALACRNEVKMRARRRRHETAAATRHESTSAELSDSDLTALTTLLDAAIDRLGTTDRQAVLLRYFENRSVGDVATELGITENTAGRRLLRATEKLRKIFSSQGVTLSVATVGSAVTAVISATAAPSARAAIASTTTAPAIRADARAVIRSLRWQIFQPIAAAAIGMIVIGGMAVWIATRPGAPTAAAGKPAPSAVLNTVLVAAAPASAVPIVPDVPENQLPGVVQLVQWDLLLNEKGYNDIGNVGVAVDSPSKLYQAMRCDSAQLRRTVAELIRTDGVAAISRQAKVVPLPQPVYDGKRYTEQFNPQFNVNEPGKFIWFFAPSLLHNDEFDRLPDGRVRLRLDHPDLNAGIADMPYRNLQRPAGVNGIVFDGAIAPGETIAFMARFVGQTGQVYCHVMAWEAFRATPAQMGTMDFPRDTGWWCQHGPEQLRLWADAARIWSDWTGWGRPAGPPSLEEKLSDGESVWLYAFCRPSEFPFCWWDPLGKPAPCWPGSTGVPLDGSPPGGIWAQVGVMKPISQFGRPVPPDDGYGEQESPGGGPIECRKIEEGSKSLTVGVPVGPWKEIARLNYGQPMTVDGVKYEIVQEPDHEGVLSTLTRTGVLDDQLHVVPVHVDGTRDHFEVQRELKWSVAGIYGKLVDSVWSGGSRAKVDYFSIRLRKREFVTFTGFAINPITIPPTKLSRQETNARLALITQQHLQHCLDQLPHKRLGYSLSWLSRKDDSWNGGMTALLGAVVNHNERKVRSMLSATDKPASDALDSLAHLMTAGELIRAAAVRRFDEPAAHDLLDRPGLFEDLEGELMGVNWAGTADMVKHVHPYADMESNDSWLAHILWTQGPTGDYTLNVTDLFPDPNAVEDLKARSRLADEVYKLISNPRTTLDEVRRQLQRG